LSGVAAFSKGYVAQQQHRSRAAPERARALRRRSLRGRQHRLRAAPRDADVAPRWATARGLGAVLLSGGGGDPPPIRRAVPGWALIASFSLNVEYGNDEHNMVFYERRRATLTSLPAGLLLVALGLCCLVEGEETLLRRPVVEPFPSGLA